MEQAKLSSSTGTGVNYSTGEVVPLPPSTGTVTSGSSGTTTSGSSGTITSGSSGAT